MGGRRKTKELRMVPQKEETENRAGKTEKRSTEMGLETKKGYEKRKLTQREER